MQLYKSAEKMCLLVLFPSSEDNERENEFLWYRFSPLSSPILSTSSLGIIACGFPRAIYTQEKKSKKSAYESHEKVSTNIFFELN